ncbi:MAG: NEW3 domain-containing protein, partial [Candidatus Zixiibacteriota bacterium]
QQSLLAVLFEEQYITVRSAVKYHAPDGSRRVTLTLANTSGGSEEFQKLVNMEDRLFKSLQPSIIHNVYVSLMNDGNAIISQPYEAKIDELHYGTPQKVDFALLQDLDAVTVFLIYGNGSQRSMKIYLEKDASVNRVAVQSEQFSQEVELGSSAYYDLTLELFSGTNNTFTLEVVNLPEQISRYFKNETGQVRLRQVKFTESGRTKKALLQITLPDRASDKVAMDESIPFYVLALPDDKLKNIEGAASRKWTEQELQDLDVGYVRLELIPRGKGELNVRAPQLYHTILPDESAEMTIELVNEGSRRLDHLEIKADPPLNWIKDIIPSEIPALEIGEEARIKLRFTPPDDIAVGKYEVRIQTSALSNGQPLNGTDKIATIEIRARANIIGTALIVLFILAIVGGVVTYGVRLSRR